MKKLKIGNIRKYICFTITIILATTVAGCHHTEEKQDETVNKQKVQMIDEQLITLTQEEEKEIDDIISICLESYNKSDDLDELEANRELINTLGGNGYIAIDSENQINMTEHEKMIQFCEDVKIKENGRITIAEVVRKGNYIIRVMDTNDGEISILRRYYVYENGTINLSSEDMYRAESWNYTGDGYLMFSGWLAFEGHYEVTRDKIMEHTAYRVQPLDETYRELNRKYILPIGYECNNMFLTDWNEEDFGELDFYDVFDICCRDNHRYNSEFVSGNAMGTSAVYLISKEKFEQMIMMKFNIASEVLQSKTVYYPEKQVYEYKPRGLEEVEYPEYPYPEVVGYKENSDGTLTLKVQAVFPYRDLSKAYVHEVTVRNTENGTVQYVGNHIIEPISDQEIAWHTPRLTRTEWEELYGGN